MLLMVRKYKTTLKPFITIGPEFSSSKDDDYASFRPLIISPRCTNEKLAFFSVPSSSKLVGNIKNSGILQNHIYLEYLTSTIFELIQFCNALDIFTASYVQVRKYQILPTPATSVRFRTRDILAQCRLHFCQPLS